MLTFDFNKIEIPEGGRILDLGCGEGRHIFGVMDKFPNSYCIGLDLHAESLKIAQEGADYFESISNEGAGFTMASGYQMPFADSSFDMVVCSEVLEHLINYEDALKEIQRVLDAAKKRNLLAGLHNGTPEYAQKMLDKGFNLVTVGSDSRYISAGAKLDLEKLKGIKGSKSKGY